MLARHIVYIKYEESDTNKMLIGSIALLIMPIWGKKPTHNVNTIQIQYYNPCSRCNFDISVTLFYLHKICWCKNDNLTGTH